MKPCPFCGLLPVIYKSYDKVMIHCNNDECEMDVQTPLVPSEEEAQRIWNQRTKSP